MTHVFCSCNGITADYPFSYLSQQGQRSESRTTGAGCQARLIFPSPGTPGEGQGGGLTVATRSYNITAMQATRDPDRRLLKFARTMRRQPTDAEAKLWRMLRMKAIAGYKFRRQHRVAGYILDFYCPSRRLAIELDGGQHADPVQAEHDRIRTMRLNQLGICVLRFWDNDALKHADAVADEILRHLEMNEPPPRPSPGVPGEGEHST
jgi:very-short-patch-repair endonuclease